MMEDDGPDSLMTICLTYCVQNLETLCTYDPVTKHYNLQEGSTLPTEICERIINVYSESGYELNDGFLNIFADVERTHLKCLNLRNSSVSDAGLLKLLHHHVVKLDLSGCELLTSNSLYNISQFGRRIQALFLGNSTRLCAIENGAQPMSSDDEDLGGNDHCCTTPVLGVNFNLDCPDIRAFSLHNLDDVDVQWAIPVFLKSFSKLTYLDISGCIITTGTYDCIEHLTNLFTLVLFDVHFNMKIALAFLSKLKQLRVLDLGNSRDEPVQFPDPEESMEELMKHLPHLNYLDISGTNLAGLEPDEDHSARPPPGLTLSNDDVETEQKSSIPWLQGRHLDFLGLLGCSYDACMRQHIPATNVTGHGSEEQVLLSVQTYIDKPELLVKSLNHLFQIFRYSTCQQQNTALQAILTAMRRHLHNKSIQISGSASLFYVVKGEEKHNLSFRTRRRTISAILDGMENNMDEATMLRNGCLTLCRFQIPQDVLFEYQRMVGILLRMVTSADQEEFVQRIGVYLLNSLACQVDGKEKKLVGDLGGIPAMLTIIKNKLGQGVCDEVMEIAWSTMWNVTDETAVNCERFINHAGMEFFLMCLEHFPDKPELLRNMMGLLGNVAEVAYLRPRLRQSEYVRLFSELLDSESDGIEVSYNACGVLAHMVSDGEDSWMLEQPSRRSILDRMVNAINKWDIKTKRNINYRSFEPILRLIPKYDTPECQHWATWAICNLTTMYPAKYCPLLEKGGGESLISELVCDHRPYASTKSLGQQILTLLDLYHTDPNLGVAEADLGSDHEDNANMDNMAE